MKARKTRSGWVPVRGRVPLLMQSEAAECGLACLAMVAASYDRRVQLAQLRSMCQVSLNGARLSDLVTLAGELGLGSRAVRLDMDALRQLRRPAILHWNLDHFVVLVKVGRRGITVHDPSLGRRRISMAQASSCFTGVALELWPERGFEGKVNDLHAPSRLGLRMVLGAVSGWPRYLTQLLGLSLVLQLLVLAGPWHVQWLVDDALGSSDVHLIGVLSTGFAVLLLLRVATDLVRGALVVQAGHFLALQLGSQLFSRLVSLPVSWFERRHVGDVTSRFASLGPVRELVTNGLAALIVDAVMVLVCLVFLLVYSAWLAAIVVAGVALHAGVRAAAYPSQRRRMQEQVMADAAEETHFLESVRGMRVVKSYGLGGLRVAGWRDRFAERLRAGMRLARLDLATGNVGALITGVELIAVVHTGALAVIGGDFTVGMLYAFLSYRATFAGRAHGLIDGLVNLKAMSVHYERLADICLAEPECGPASNSSEVVGRVPLAAGPAGVPVSLTLQDAGFRYGRYEPWLFRSAHLHIPAGSLVAIIGPSGAGKSSLLKVLMGITGLTEGQVCVDGRVLLPEQLPAYRSRTGCVVAEDGLFAGSLAENVALFDERPDLERLAQAFALAELAPVVARLPMGENTRITDMGATLSSGELQRVMLARALYRHPDVLFLDEGTAHMDTVTAAQIHALVLALPMTRVMVTHDRELAERADWVVEVAAPSGVMSNVVPVVPGHHSGAGLVTVRPGARREDIAAAPDLSAGVRARPN